MPVPHGHEAVSVDAFFSQGGFQRAGLAFSVRTDRGASADRGVMMLHFSRARGRDQLGERLTSDAGKREVDNVRVAEEVVKEWLDRFQRVGSAELKENYPHTPCCARHSPEPQNGRHFTPNGA